MKFLITFPAHNTTGKKSKLMQPVYKTTEAFNIEQAKRRAGNLDWKQVTIQPLEEWIESIPTI